MAYSPQKLYDTLQASTKANSLLKKNLTPETFAKLKDRKTKLGGTLSDCIRSGVENLDSGCGLYACDAEAYETFRELFDGVIKDYHKVKGEIQHPEPNFGDVSVFGNVDPEGKFVVSTRIRVGRSQEGYGFPPLLSEKEKKDMEQRAIKAFDSFSGEHKGTYYPLVGMDAATERKLIDDHFLFKNDDRFLKSAGGYNHWPVGRGIFHNEEKSFLVWVNEEDHFRMISMQMGGDIGQVYSRLVKGVSMIEGSGIKFSKNPRLGMITFCPTNLGTTCRASVHIRIPYLSSRPDFHQICERLNLQPRGIHGEHTESVGGVYDISNKRRLGLTEFDAVKEMYEGVKSIIWMEQNKRLDLEPMYKRLTSSPDVKSLVKKHLTQEVFDKLKDKQTTLGGTLAECIQSGVENLDSGCGLYACDTEAYDVFSDLFFPVIADYHKVEGEVSHPEPTFGDLENLEFGDLDPENKYIVSTRIRVGRSHAGKAFPPMLTEQDKKDMEASVKKAVDSFSGEHKGTYYPLVGMDAATERKLIDDHFLFKNDDRFLKSAGGYNHWPVGRGIFHNEEKSFLVWVNEEDHLRIISMEQGGNVGRVYTRLVKGIQAMEQSGLSFAKHPRLGYVTFCPTNLGTTCRASVHIRIPWFSKQPEFKDMCEKMKLQPRGIHGEHTESVGGVYDLSNKRRLGLTEYDAVKEMCDGIKKIIEMESQQKIL